MARFREKDSPWSDPQYKAAAELVKPIYPIDTLEEVILKTLEYPGVTLLDWAAFPKHLAKEIRSWMENGGTLQPRKNKKKSSNIGSRQKDNILNPLDNRPRKTYYQGDYKVGSSRN